MGSLLLFFLIIFFSNIFPNVLLQSRVSLKTTDVLSPKQAKSFLSIYPPPKYMLAYTQAIETTTTTKRRKKKKKPSSSKTKTGHNASLRKQTGHTLLSGGLTLSRYYIRVKSKHESPVCLAYIIWTNLKCQWKPSAIVCMVCGHTHCCHGQ